MKVLVLVFAVAVVALMFGAVYEVAAPANCGGCSQCTQCVHSSGPFESYPECVNTCPDCMDPPCQTQAAEKICMCPDYCAPPI